MRIEKRAIPILLFVTVLVGAGLVPAGTVEAQPLPDRWAYFHYPNVDVVGDKVFVRYAVGSPLLGVAEQNLQKQGSILRIYPMEWFYE